jgi:phytanoyl-CoA hydroxylase
MLLTDVQRKNWQENGYLYIEGFFDEAEVDAVQSSVDRTWEQRPANVTVDDLVTGKRLRASGVADDELDHNFKLNDLYLVDDNVRGVISSDRVSSIVTELLGDQSVIINTLNLNKGSEQPDHLDTLYMTPLTDHDLVATWMALEDTDEDSGPLRYWPGSQRIDPYRFANGRLHFVPEEMDQWADYMAGSVDRLGLSNEHFVAKRGDLFIWSAFLLHGGSEICNPGLTRKSLVTHFWSKADCERLGVTTRPVERGGGLWLDRSPQPIPGEEPVAAPEPEPPASNHEGTSKPSLFERLRSLAWRPDD